MLFVRLFKKSGKTRVQFEKEIYGISHTEEPVEKDNNEANASHSQSKQEISFEDARKLADKKSSQVITDLIYLDNGTGDIDYEPKKQANALKYMNMAIKEIDYLSQQEATLNQGKCPQKRLSMLQKNRLALKFVEMNASPEKFNYYNKYTDENIKSVRLNLLRIS